MTLRFRVSTACQDCIVLGMHHIYCIIKYTFPFSHVATTISHSFPHLNLHATVKYQLDPHHPPVTHVPSSAQAESRSSVVAMELSTSHVVT